jgi:hypothetical protein
MCDENSNPEMEISKTEPPEPKDVSFDDVALMEPTPLERELGHEVDEDEALFVHVAQKVFGADAKRAAAGYQLYRKLGGQQQEE